MAVIKTIGKLAPKAYKQMIDHLTRKKIKNPFIKAKDIVVNKKPEVEQTEMFNRFNKANPRQDMAGGGMLVQPGFGGTRQGYSGDAIKLPDSPDAGTKSLGNNVYKVTSKKGFKTYFVNLRGKKKHFGKDKKAAENFVKKEKAKPDTRKKKKSVIEIQSEGGTLLEKPKYKNALARAMNEVNALQEKGYGNIDKIVKKYQKLFVKKIGSKTIQGKTVKKGFASTEDRAITFAIRQQAKKLGIQSIKNENIIKALDAYSKIKNPKRGNIPKIVKRFNVPESSFNRYLKESKLNLRKKIPLQFGSEAEKRKYYYRLRKEAIDEFSSQKFEKFLSAPETSLVQKSHLGDLYNQYVRTGNLGYAPSLINQETLKDVDAILKEYNEEINDLFEKKPKDYRKKIDLLNQKGTDLAAATQGYKKFTGRDPFTGKEFIINFSRPSQELDPTELLENKKLSDLTNVDKPTLEMLKKDAIKNAKLKKKEIIAMDKKITSEVEKVLLKLSGQIDDDCAGAIKKELKKDGGRIGLQSIGSRNVCITKAKNYMNEQLERGIGTQQNAKTSLIKRILTSSANILKQNLSPKELLKMENLIGKPALYGAAAFETGLVADDVLRKGEPLNVAAAESLFGSVLNLDADAAKAKNLLESNVQLSPAAKEYAQNILDYDKYRKLELSFPSSLVGKSMPGSDKYFKMQEDLKKKIESTPDTGAFDYQSALDESEGTFKAKPKTINIFGRDVTIDAPDAPDVTPLTNKLAQPAGRRVGPMTAKRDMQIDLSLPTYDRSLTASDDFLNQYLKSIGQEPLRPGEGTFFRMQEPNQRGLFGTQEKFAGGGIAKIAGVDQGPPPERGPNSQGLLSLKNRVRNL